MASAPAATGRAPETASSSGSGLEGLAVSALISVGSAMAGVVGGGHVPGRNLLLEGPDVKEVTRGCFAVAAEAESSKQARQSTLVQLSFLKAESEVFACPPNAITCLLLDIQAQTSTFFDALW